MKNINEYHDKDCYICEKLEGEAKGLCSRCNPKVSQQACLHDSCRECFGTGIKEDGSMCVHYIACHCPKCSPR